MKYIRFKIVSLMIPVKRLIWRSSHSPYWACVPAWSRTLTTTNPPGTPISVLWANKQWVSFSWMNYNINNCNKYKVAIKMEWVLELVYNNSWNLTPIKFVFFKNKIKFVFDLCRNNRVQPVESNRYPPLPAQLSSTPASQDKGDFYYLHSCSQILILISEILIFISENSYWILFRCSTISDYWADRLR